MATAIHSLSIGSVARLTGLSPFTLRAWEKRYGTCKPRRTATGRRYYSETDVQKLSLLKQLVGRGYSIGSIASLGIAGLAKLSDKSPQLKSTTGLKEVKELEEALDSLALAEFATGFKAAQIKHDTRNFLVQIVSPLMRRIGSRVAAGEIDVFHEHIASAIVRSALMGILYSTERSTRFTEQTPFVFATPEGDHHELGILIGAILAILNGKRALYLGPNLPADSLLRVAKAVKSRSVVLAVSAPQEALDEETLRAYVSALRAKLPKDSTLMLAGERAAEIGVTLRTKDAGVRFLSTFEEFERELGG